MRVAIIIPAYNAEKYLALTLDSVLAQAFADWELIVVDDGSRDGSRGIAEAYAEKDRRIRVAHQPNGGVAVARQHGYALVSPQTEAMVFLDSDDVWEPEALATLTGALEGRPEAVGAYALLRCINAEGRPIRLGEQEVRMRGRLRIEEGQVVPCLPQDLTTFACFALRQCIPTPGAVLLRRTALETTGGFDQAAAPGEDYDLYIRLTRLGGMLFVDRVLLGYRSHADNTSNDTRRMHRIDRAVRRRQINSGENTPEQKRLLQVGFRLRERESYDTRMREVWAGLVRHEYAGALKTFAYAQANLVRSLREPS